VKVASQLLKLVPDRWYGWQMVPGYFGERNVPYFSPMRVVSITPLKTGRGILKMSFWNILYAEGVQDFNLDLRVLKHEANYMIGEIHYAASGPDDRSAVISHIEFDWIRHCCPSLWAFHPPETMSPAAQRSVSVYLDELFPQKEEVASAHRRCLER